MLGKGFRYGLGSLVLIMALVVGLSGCRQASPKASKQKPIHVVASVNFYGEVAQKVLGNHGRVTTIIQDSSVDPHDFKPTPKEATVVSRATFVLGNGLGYDGWLDKLAKSQGQSVKTIHVATDVMGLKEGDNEHVWYDPATMPRLANDLARQFGKQAPQYRQVYQRNAKAYIRSLRPLQRQIAQVKKQRLNQPVAASEPVFDYALKSLGYQRISDRFEHAVENGTDPAPKDLQRLQTAIKERKIAFFVNNKQTSQPTVRRLVKLAHQAKVPVLNVTETQPQGLTYAQWMLREYRQLAKIQRAAAR